MSALDLATVTSELFTPAVGQVFEAVFTDGRLPLTLAEVRPIGTATLPGAREPFTLTFDAAPGLRLPQRIYRLENPTVGAMEIFLVQIVGDAKVSQFEAIFN